MSRSTGGGSAASADSDMLFPAADGDRGGAYLVGPVLPGTLSAEAEEHVDELSSLADTAGFRETGRAVLSIRRMHPGTFFGKGQVEEIGVVARGFETDVLIIDHELSPGQLRNLEKSCEMPVVDRAGLILDIFAQRARSREARTQVELARLQYLLPRLAGRWAHLSRQAGGGPGGTKGEGEKQIELDRRMIGHRIARLRRELTRIDRGREVRSKSRRATPQAALVGYTNVGKSSLFNRLTRSDVVVEDRLFATLDTTVRKVPLPVGESFLAKDTVGFIRKLPHNLVASFRSTFREAGEADLMVLVVDLSHPLGEEQLSTVERVLEETDLADRARLLVFNKIDLVPPEVRTAVKQRRPDALMVSATTGEGIDDLVEAVAERLLGRLMTSICEVPFERKDVLAEVHRRGRVHYCEENGEGMRIKVTARGRLFEDLQRMLDDGS